MKISLIVVVYNKAIDEIACLPYAEASKLVEEIIVCDNSSCKNNNALIAKKMNIAYLSMGGNQGLSRAYNAGIKECEGDVICIFDDDTEIGIDYFDAIFKLWKSKRTWDVALPLVLADGMILSPNVFNGYRAHPYKNPADICEGSQMMGINSGMIVKRSVYDCISYDERLFLDFIDYKFLQDIQKQGLIIVYLPGPTLYQDYSLQTDDSARSFLRLQIWERDSAVFFENTFSKKVFRLGALMKRRINLALRFKSLRFLYPKTIKEAS